MTPAIKACLYNLVHRCNGSVDVLELTPSPKKIFGRMAKAGLVELKDGRYIATEEGKKAVAS